MPLNPNWWDTKFTAATVKQAAQESISGLQSVNEVPEGGSTDQVLTKNSATDGDVSWKTPSGGGSTKEYASFYLSTGGATGISTSATTLVLNNTSVNSNGSVFVLAANLITITKTGTFKFTIDVYLNYDSTSRSEAQIWLEKTSSEILGTRSAIYLRGYGSGHSASISTIQSVTTGDIFRIRAIRTDGGAVGIYQGNNGTRLTIEEK